MTWTPAHPEWVAPSVAAISDLHWLSYRAQLDTGAPRAAGVCAAVAWVRGGRNGPVSERDEQPVTRAVATAEMWAAAAAATPGATPPPLEAIATELQVAFHPPVAADPGYADGAWRTLRWLLGQPGQTSPMPLPARTATGVLLDVEGVMLSMSSAEPWRHREPEERAALRRQAEAQVRRSSALVELIEQTRNTVTTSR